MIMIPRYDTVTNSSGKKNSSNNNNNNSKHGFFFNDDVKNIYDYFHIYIYIHIYIHTCMHSCIHTYIYIYTHIHIYSHIYTYIYSHLDKILRSSSPRHWPHRPRGNLRDLGHWPREDLQGAVFQRKPWRSSGNLR